MTTVTIRRACPLCEKESEIEVDASLYREWSEGLIQGKPASTHSVQVLFRHLSADDRETIISGVHPACWDAAFAPKEGDE